MEEDEEEGRDCPLMLTKSVVHEVSGKASNGGDPSQV
ncbi:hypothetical protein AMTRI_Chr09g38270 [Amborella trichopoda]